MTSVLNCLARAFLLAIGLFMLLLPLPAEAANRVHLWYDHSSAPAGHSRDDMHTLIMLAIREWEEHSNGQVVYRFMGDVAPGERVAGPATITIVWDSTLGTSCGAAHGYCPNVPFTCTIALNPLKYTLPLRTPPAAGSDPNGCGVHAYGTLLHEMAHLLYPTPTGDHFTASVLATGVSPAADRFAIRHLWNRDMDSVSTVYNPASSVAIRYDEIDSNGALIQTISPVQGTASGEYGNFVAGISVGGGSNAYARISAEGRGSTSPRRVFIEQNPSGDLTTWTDRRTLGGATRHAACIATGTAGTTLFAAWTHHGETPQGVNGVLEGSRQVMFSQSGNSGLTWTTPVAIPDALTRSGVSCFYDNQNAKFVVGFSGAGDEAIWLVHKTASTSWTPPRRVDEKETVTARRVFSPFGPNLSYDVFSQSPAVISWFDWQTFRHRHQTLMFNASMNRYEFTAPAGTVHPQATWDEFETSLVRGAVVPNVIGSLYPWAFAAAHMWCSSGGCPRSGRDEKIMLLARRTPTAANALTPWTSTFDTFTSPVAGDFQEFVSSAPHRHQVQNAYVRYVLVNSN